MRLIEFFRNEDGQITVDWTVLVAALAGLGFVVVAEVASGVDKVADEYDGITTGQGMMTMFANPTNTGQPGGDAEDPADEDTVASADDTETCDKANPGNDKCVGNAGETPNGDEDAWGDGSNGQGDVSGNAGNNGNNGGGRGHGRGNR